MIAWRGVANGVRVLALLMAAAGATTVAWCADRAAQSTTTTLVLLNGSARTATALEIHDGKLRIDDVASHLTLDDLLRIEQPAVPTARSTSTIAIELRGGGNILADEVAIANEQCRILWLGEPLSIPLEEVRSIQLDRAVRYDDFERVRAAPPAESDRVFLRDEPGALHSISATATLLDTERLTLDAAGQTQHIARSRLFGIVVAQPAVIDPAPHCLAILADGSRLGGRSFALAGDRAALALAGGGEVRFAWPTVTRLVIRSPRMAYLSDLKPIQEEQQPLVTLPFPAQRDRSVTGQPLRIGSQAFEKGLGVHARSLITFAAEKPWDLLCATIGLDAAASGKGDCVFVVLADGAKIFERRVRGSDPAAPIQVPIGGRSQVTLCVEPGADLDLADHANWAEARFVNSR